MKLLLCLQNLVLVVAGDYDLVPRPNEGAGRAVAEYIRKERGKVYGRVRGRLDELDVSAMSAADEIVERKLELDRVDLSGELNY